MTTVPATIMCNQPECAREAYHLRHRKYGPICRPCYAKLWRKERKKKPGRVNGKRGVQCKVPGCGGPDYSRGMCSQHYNRFWRYGNARVLMAVDEDGELVDAYTKKLLMRLHDGAINCAAPDFKPRRVWRAMGYVPAEGAIPLLALARHAFQVFCAHQVVRRASHEDDTQAIVGAVHDSEAEES